jgi:hypothetical protein
VVVEPAKLWLALSRKGSESVFPSVIDPCLSCASFMRLTQTGAGGRLRSPNLSATKRRDPRTHFDPGRNLVVD